MKKSLEFDLPEGCDSISFGRDLNAAGIKREDCDPLYRLTGDESWTKLEHGWTSFSDSFTYAYRLKPVAQAEELDGWQPIETYTYREEKVLVRNSDSHAVTCAYGLVKGGWSMDCTINEPTHWMPIQNPPKPDTVTVEVELPTPAEGKKWEETSHGKGYAYCKPTTYTKTWTEVPE